MHQPVVISKFVHPSHAFSLIFKTPLCIATAGLDLDHDGHYSGPTVDLHWITNGQVSSTPRQERQRRGILPTNVKIKFP